MTKKFSVSTTQSIMLLAVLFGYGCAQDLLINNTQDFLKFVSDVNNFIDLHHGQTVMLNADLDLSGHTFDPIGSSNYGYRGYFDGNGHTISGLNMTSNKTFVGLFGQVYFIGSIRNLVLDETCSVTATLVSDNGNCYLAGIVSNIRLGWEDFLVENCVNMASVTFVGNSGTGSYSIARMGGIVGSSSPSEVRLRIANCVNKGVISNEGSAQGAVIGGIIGYFDSNITLSPCVIERCSNYGTIRSAGVLNYDVRIGGIVGWGLDNFVLEKCVNYGSVLTRKMDVGSYVSVGGVIGHANIGDFSNPSVLIRNCENHGSVTDSTSNFIARTGGILGVCEGKNSSNPCVIVNCLNDGTILNDGNPTYKNVGGIIGHSSKYNEIENCVNLGVLIGEGNMSIKNTHLSVGGIAGYGETTEFRNCANYGKFELGGNVEYFYSGGIVGYSNWNEVESRVENCLNYGHASQNGEAAEVHCGGIVGNSGNTVIDNCVASGSFNFTNRNALGGIVGLGISSDVTKSYWRDTLASGGIGLNSDGLSTITDSHNYSFASGSSQPITTGAGEDLIPLLNSAAASLGYAKWAQNAGERAVAFVVNGKAFAKTDSHIILFPSFVEYEDNAFAGWYSDSFLSEAVSPLPAELASDTTLYGAFGDLRTMTFKYGSPAVAVRSTQVKGAALLYPEYAGTKEGHTLKWCTEDESSCDPEVVPEADTTFVETYSINTYTATFSNGYDESETTAKPFQYGEDITYPTLSRPGYTFEKWESDVAVTDNKMPAANVTFTARWIEITEYVEITLEKKVIEKEEIAKIIKKYTDGDFVIESIFTGEEGETKVIIKFIDKENAKEFVRKVDETGRDDISYVRPVDYQESDQHSDMSPALLCSLSLILLIL